MDIGPDSDLTASITPDVMTCFRRSHFFEQLDDLLCPKGDSGQRQVCGGDYKISKRILEAAGFDSNDLKDMFAVLRAKGACCDCEVLYNVAESSRLKAEYWKPQAHGKEAKPKHGKAEWAITRFIINYEPVVELPTTRPECVHGRQSRRSNGS